MTQWKPNSAEALIAELEMLGANGSVQADVTARLERTYPRDTLERALRRYRKDGEHSPSRRYLAAIVLAVITGSSPPVRDAAAAAEFALTTMPVDAAYERIAEVVPELRTLEGRIRSGELASHEAARRTPLQRIGGVLKRRLSPDDRAAFDVEIDRLKAVRVIRKAAAQLVGPSSQNGGMPLAASPIARAIVTSYLSKLALSGGDEP